jgi:hypothetical protein
VVLSGRNLRIHWVRRRGHRTALSISSAHAKNASYRNSVETLVCRPKDVLHCVKASRSSLSALWRQTLAHGIPALALVAGVRSLHSRDVTSTFTDFTNPSFTVCFDNHLGFFSLECTDNGRDVGPDHIELRVPARGIAASDPVLCGCARPIGNFPSRQQAINMPYRAMQLTEHRHAAIFVCFRLILCYIA